jgi:hypothetical protein
MNFGSLNILISLKFVPLDGNISLKGKIAIKSMTNQVLKSLLLKFRITLSNALLFFSHQSQLQKFLDLCKSERTLEPNQSKSNTPQLCYSPCHQYQRLFFKIVNGLL